MGAVHPKLRHRVCDPAPNATWRLLTTESVALVTSPDSCAVTAGNGPVVTDAVAGVDVGLCVSEKKVRWKEGADRTVLCAAGRGKACSFLVISPSDPSTP
jgi:hypothetical protein